jgi:hypothetical protein
MPKFLENKKIFEKHYQKVSAATTECQKKISTFQPLSLPPRAKKNKNFPVAAADQGIGLHL